MYSFIGNRVRMARKRKNLTQAQLAECCGLSDNMISRIETYQSSTSLDTLCRICEVLEIGLDYVLYDILPKETRSYNPIVTECIRILETFSEEEQQFALEHLSLYSSQIHKRSITQPGDEN